MPREKRYEETTDARRGEAYSVRPEFARTGVARGDVMRGRVVFVPKHRRYAVIEFMGPGGGKPGGVLAGRYEGQML